MKKKQQMSDDQMIVLMEKAADAFLDGIRNDLAEIDERLVDIVFRKHPSAMTIHEKYETIGVSMALLMVIDYFDYRKEKEEAGDEDE